MKRSAERGFTLVEIMIVVAIIALLAAIAIPNVLRGRTTANETAAIGNMRAVISSLEMYRSVNNLYPLDVAANTWMAVMYGPGATPALACAAANQPVPDFGPPSFCQPLTPSLIQGFNYTFTAGPTVGATYDLIAIPATAGTTGTRSFYTNESGIIRHCREVAAAATAANGRTPSANWVTIDAALPAVGTNCN